MSDGVAAGGQNRGSETYLEGGTFSGTVGFAARDARAAWPVKVTPPPTARSVVVIVLDDLGFGQLGCYGGVGGRVDTPDVDRLAASGLRYNNFHVSSMCSATRAALLSGRNSHSVGVGKIMEVTRGFPGYHGRILKDTALLPAMLAQRGYFCMALGKWHLTPMDEVTPIGPFDRWPLGQGFHRYYGFQGACTDQWSPQLVEDNHALTAPENAPGEYHLSEDLTDHAVRWIEEHEAIAPGDPYFLYLAYGAVHRPHHVGESWAEPYRGMFSAGWDVIREETFERQKELGILPEGTRLPERNAGVPLWMALDRGTRHLMERQMEVFAGFLSHTDHQIGRLVAYLDRRGTLEDTLIMVVSDNGTSGEGGRLGTVSVRTPYEGDPDTLEVLLAHERSWGAATTYPNYASGWAMVGNTPNRWYKQFTHEGGTRVPLIVHWPSTIRDGGAIRAQFHSAPDVVPTILEAFDVDAPDVINGVKQRSLEGTSFAYTFDSADAPTRKEKQYFEMFGHRAIWSGGWKAVTAHWTSRLASSLLGDPLASRKDGQFNDDEWELYHLDVDFSESRDLASQHADKLAEMKAMWAEEAERYRALPLDDSHGPGESPGLKRIKERSVFSFFSSVELSPAASPNLRNRSHVIAVRCVLQPGARGGVIVSDGGAEGGYSFGVDGAGLFYASNYNGREVTVARLGCRRAGRCEFKMVFESYGNHDGSVVLVANGAECAPVEVRRTNLIRYDSRAAGLRIGSDTGSVWSGYVAPFRFDGEIEVVNIACVGAEFRDLAALLEVGMSEQ